MITEADVRSAMDRHPGAKVLVHPECREEVTRLADYIGSTSGIIDYATTSAAREFIIVTELGVMYELKQRNPEKQFYPAAEHQICDDMKKLTLDKIISVLEQDGPGLEMPEDFMDKAHAPLKRMLELSR